MTLNPRIFANAGSLYLEWDVDPNADGYRMTAPDGSIHQVGRNQTIVKLGQPAQPFTVSVASDYPAAAESLTYPAAPPAALTVTQNLKDGDQITAAVDWTATTNNPVDEVDFYIDAALKQIDITPPYTYHLDPAALTDGPHTFTVRALDPTGKSAMSDVTATTKKPTPPPPVTSKIPAYGVSPGYNIRTWPAADFTRNLQLIKDLAQGKPFAVRFDAFNDSTTWRVNDALIAAGLTPYNVLYGTTGPRGADDQGKQLAARYKGKGVIFSVTNEPDLNGWTPDGLADFTKAVYQSVKAGDANALCGYGGMWKGGAGMQAFAKSAAARAKGFFDFYPFHGKGFQDTSQAWSEYAYAFNGGYYGTNTIQGILAANGIPVPIINDEGGGGPNASQANQSTWIKQQLDRTKAGPCAAVFMYSVTDNDGAHEGIVNNDGTPRPAYTTFKSFMGSV